MVKNETNNFNRFSPKQSKPVNSMKKDFDPLLEAYLKEVSYYPVLSKKEQLAAFRKYKDFNDEEARNLLIVSNLLLVVKIAFENYKYTNLAILDLIQAGNKGLAYAPEKFDPSKGSSFSYYASFWIRARILSFIVDNWSLVKIKTTQSQRKLFFRLNSEKQKLKKLGLAPTVNVIAKCLNLKEEKVIEMEKRLANGDISLDSPLHETGEETQVDRLPSGVDVEKIVLEKIQKEQWQKLIRQFRKTLGKRERFIFDNRMCCDDPLILRDIGNRFCCSRETIRQLEKEIKKKLIHFKNKEEDKLKVKNF